MPAATAAGKADDQRVKTDKDGYLETSIGAAYDDRCSGYLDAVEPVPSGNQPDGDDDEWMMITNLCPLAASKSETYDSTQYLTWYKTV